MMEKISLMPEERGLLGTTASMVGHSVLIANADVPRRVRQKARALNEAYSSTARDFASNRLVHDTVREAEQKSKEEGSFRSLRKERETYLAETLELCHKVDRLLAVKATPAEGDEFKHWLLAIGERVGESVATGEFLGIGSERFSQEEIDVLKAVAGALGLASYRGPKARSVQMERS